MKNPKPPPSYLYEIVARRKKNERVENLQLFTAGGDYSWAVTTVGPGEE